MAVQQVVSYSSTLEGRSHFADTDVIRFLCRMIGDGDLVRIRFCDRVFCLSDTKQPFRTNFLNNIYSAFNNNLYTLDRIYFSIQF